MNNNTTIHVPSGSFQVGKKQKLIYKACLGTCLGITLFDPVACVGGLIHILLPHPPSNIPPEHPEKYATTGLPLFLKEMTTLGADRENLTATLAGGALVGPISQQDMKLDIGGRSVENALSFLKQEGIQIRRSETGGFFSCTIEINMSKGTTVIKPAGSTPQKENFTFSPPTYEEITETIARLQPIPQSALKILRMIQQGDYNLNDISQELAQDQVLGARTLKLCNSAMFAGRIKIDTLNDAILLLGETLLIKSVITAAVKNYFNQTGVTGYSLCKGGLFFHAVGVGTTAEIIAALTKKADPKTAYTAGLLHDIGKVVLDQYIARACPLFFRGVHKEKESALEIEKKILKTTHCSTGAFLARQWQFSQTLINVIYYHHTPEKAPENKELVGIVYLADLIMSRFDTGLELEQIKTGHLESTLELLDLEMEDLFGLIDAIPLNAFNHEEI